MLDKKMKKAFASLLSVILALSCCFSAIPLGAFAADENVLGEEIVAVADAGDGARTNLALHAKYTGTDAYSENGRYFYPDTDYKELTDGVIGGDRYSEDAYVGYAGGDHDIELIIDFGYNQTFDEVKLHYACGASAGIVPPKAVDIAYSSDKLNWTEFAVGGPGKSEDIALEYTLTGEKSTARFVKVHIKYGLYWYMMSEIEIMGVWAAPDPKRAVVTTDLPTNIDKFEGETANLKMDYTLDEQGDEVEIVWKKDNVVLPQFNNLKKIKISDLQLSDSGAYQAFIINKFNDGTEVSSDSSACLITVQESAIDPGTDSDTPDSDANNLAFAKSYTIEGSLANDYTDAKYLTDGLYGTDKDYLDGRWVGFDKEANSTPAVIVDLGASKSFEQINVNFMRDTIAKSEYPSKVEVFASDNQIDWTAVKSFDIKKISSDATLIYKLEEKAAGKGRYVKFVFTAGDRSILLVDEVRVLAKTNISDPGDPDALPNPNPSNIAYNMPYTVNYAANEGYPDTQGKELTDGVHGPSNNFRAPEWAGFNVMMNEGTPVEVVLDLGTVKNFKGAKIEFLDAANAAIFVPEHVKMEISSDNANWTLVSEGDTAGFVGSGSVKSFVYSGDTNLAAKYVKFTSSTSQEWIFIDEIEILTDTSDDPNTKTPYNIIRDKAYTISRLPDNGADGVLTDGRYGVASNIHDKNWVGFLKSKDPKNNHVEMVFDLKGMHTLSKISLFSREDASLKLETPRNLKFYVSNDGNKWTTLKTFNKGLSTFGLADDTAFTWDCTNVNDAFISTSPDMTKPYTGFVKVAFDVPLQQNVYTYMDEIKVEGVFGQTTDGGVCLGDGSDPYNVAAKKTYTLSPEEPVNDFPDDGTKLTDGNRGVYSLDDPAWVGFEQAKTMSGKATDRWALKTIVVDLEEVHSINKIVLSAISCGFAGRKCSPWCITMFASMDGENWMPLSRNSSMGVGVTGLFNYGWRNPDENNGKSQDLTDDKEASYKARYVRIDLELKEWNLIDEIEIYGVKGEAEGAKDLTNLSTLENSKRYQQVSEEKTNGVQDMVLCYNGWYGIDANNTVRGNWAPEQYRPYLTYVNPDGTVEDTMFDTVCLLGLRSPYGASYTGVWEGNIVKAVAKDWEWYLDKTLKKGGDVYNLNEAAKKASQELGDPNYKVKLTVMFPGIDQQVTNFGSLEGSRYLDLSEEADREYATDWWLDKVFTSIKENDYQYIELVGMYELNEQLDFRDSVQYTSNKVHSYGDYKYYWIPHYRSCGYLWGADYGIDCTAFQPNHFFTEPEDDMDFGALGTKQVENALKLASYANIGIEFECDDGMFDRPNKYNQGLDYLNAFEKLNADGPGVYRNWYQGLRTLSDCASSNNVVMRRYYDYCYQMMQGTYTQKEYIDSYGTTENPRSEGSNAKIFLGPDAPGDVPNMGENTGAGSSGGGSDGSTKPEKPTTPDVPSVSGKLTWENKDGVWKLKDADGKYATGWQKVNGQWYYMNSDAVMQKGWTKVGDTWYYLKDSGAMQTGWMKLGNTWYYLKDSGAMQTGWLKVGDAWYYLKSSGAMATGWNWIGGKCYYLNSNGKMAVNTTIGGYKVDASGAWVK